MLSTNLHEALLQLGMKEILARLTGVLSFTREQRSHKEALIAHVMANAPAQELEFLH